MRVVAALGGNALLERGEPADSAVQEAHVLTAVQSLAPLAESHQLLITHGNGPQVGLLALESATDPALSCPYPLDVLTAQTQGMIGYWLVQALHNALPSRQIACIVSRTLVSAEDPAFTDPTKFVGPMYDQDQASKLAAEHGWQVRIDGTHWRRVVPSPEPADLIDLALISSLVANGTIVICAGGGGIPVMRDQAGQLRGVDAVVDKDLTAALVAKNVDADALMLLTDVEAVQERYGTPAQRPLRQVTVADLRKRSFPAGSMGPKVEAACRFAATPGKQAMIGRLADAAALLEGTAGTVITC